MTRALPSRLVLLGHPVSHSLSPRIQNAALAAAGIPLRYSALDVEASALPHVIAHLHAEGAAGNVTIPHKSAVFEMCDQRSDVAERSGAVNTFWFDNGMLVGDNTDVAGFDVAARELLARHGRSLPRRVTILGAGGAAAAVATAAAWTGTTITVWARNAARSDAFAQRFADTRAETDLLRAVDGADLVVNATPTGMHGDGTDMPVAIEHLSPQAAIIDLVYRVGETAWVRAAHTAGMPACDGLAMLVEQAARAFARWTGVQPDRSVMWRAATEREPTARR